jgi:broad specificity phosphatase PhoE
MKFYLFRHGETDWNKEMRIQGSTDTELNTKGLEQAHSLIPKLKDLGLEAVFSSDLKRAFKTGELVAQALGIPIFKEKRLREANFGEAEGRTVDEVKGLYGEDLWHKFRNFSPGDRDIRFPGGESRGESVKRMRSVIEELIANPDYQKVGIATHGGVVCNLLLSYLPEGSPSLKVPNCVVYELSFSGADNYSVKGPL